ncbi:hypothetical protein [Parachryseolinea silvisoli]|uniref:hypothetical protein n=1 Tax=Parachryseolinea silvisoli TaxID=2873601 RepID=UPI002265BF9D|nr:hypothetical protein [Parachryseolinea silvisoli]MCD9020084.1 hypothetical protein [Parachryseolinea silvisoli]
MLHLRLYQRNAFLQAVLLLSNPLRRHRIANRRPGITILSLACALSDQQGCPSDSPVPTTQRDSLRLTGTIGHITASLL